MLRGYEGKDGWDVERQEALSLKEGARNDSRELGCYLTRAAESVHICGIR
jgi:hypothetical protein